MSYGHWIWGAEASIVNARQALRGGRPADDKTITDMAVARSRVYLGLAGLTEVLANLPPAQQMPQRDAEPVAGDEAASAARLHRVLVVAAAPGQVVTTRQPRRPASRALAEAARQLSIAREILLTHVPPRRAPLTAEGAAIRAGAGQDAALGDVARLLHQMVLADTAIADWLTNSPAQSRPAYRALLRAAEWASTSNLAPLARELIIAGNRHPSLLHGLTAAGAPGMPSAPIRHAADAADRLAGLCSWLYRNPRQLRVAHLAVGTRLGLSTCLSAGVRQARLPWTDAAITASHLDGTPADTEGHAAVEEMRQLGRWIQDDIRNNGPANRGERQAAYDRLATTLPLLADVLRRGMRTVVPRGEVFCRDGARLEKTPGQMIFHSVGVWRVAEPWSEQIVDVHKALTAAAKIGPPPHTVDRVISRGFLPLAVAAQVPTARPATPRNRRSCAPVRR